MRKRGFHVGKRILSCGLTAVLLLSGAGGSLSGGLVNVLAADTGEIGNSSLKATIGDLGQIANLGIINNRTNSRGQEINFVLPNSTSPQNSTSHQWMGEMIFSYRASSDGTFPDDRSGFTEVDTNKTMAEGGSTTYSDATEHLADNPYIKKSVVSDKKVEISYIGKDLSADGNRVMKGFDAISTYDMDTEDGSLLWSITLKNKSDQYIELGDVGLPMPWNNKYTSTSSVYNDRVTAHTFAGADSGYAYAIRCSGEGNYILFTPVPESGARIEYVDNWMGNNNGVRGERSDGTFANWTSDSGGWQPGLSVYYIHSKDISKTGRGYFTDATSLVLDPGAEKTYQFKFSAVRAGDNTPQESADSPNNASDAEEEREANMRSILYRSGMIDAIAVPGFQTAINMPTKLDLHYDDAKIRDVSVDIQCVHENDPFDADHIPEQSPGLVNNSRSGDGEHNVLGYEESAKLIDTKTVDGENHHIYQLQFGCIGNNSVRVSYKLKTEDGYVDKFTQFEFNALDDLDKIVDTHAEFMVNNQQVTDTGSAEYGNYRDWYLSTGRDDNTSHWGDDWGHDNINFMTMKNYAKPDAEEVRSLENYLVDYMWNNYMKYTQDTFTVANYLSASGVYGTSASPYTRTYSEMMECTGFFNMYRIEKAYPNLISYRKSARFYLEKAYGIYMNRVDAGNIGYYGEQQVPDMIEALSREGMTEQAEALKEKFARQKGTSMATAAYPYGSEFTYDNTGEEGAYAAAKALREYYPDSAEAQSAWTNMRKAEWKTRAMRGIQPTWYQYADPVFIGGESWWNFQYTASLAGSIMDDYLRYQDNGWDGEDTAWAARVNYGAKISNFNAVNMGQISDKSIGADSWRYTMYKGGHGAMNVNDGGTRVMNNGWNDFSGESDEGLYGSLLRISSDVVTDPVFGLTGYGAQVSESADGKGYTVTPVSGAGKRINLLDQKIYAELVQEEVKTADIKSDGSKMTLAVKNTVGADHLLEIRLSGAGLQEGYHNIVVNGTPKGQVFIRNHTGSAYVEMSSADAQIDITADPALTNTAPSVYAISEKADLDNTELPESAKDKVRAGVPFVLESTAYDDGAENGTETYKWEVKEVPAGAELTFTEPEKPHTKVNASLPGTYTVSLTVSDGSESFTKEKMISVAEAPERQAPEIIKAEGKQNAVNTTTADLTAEAKADPVYQGTVTYSWTLLKTPEGAQAVIADAAQAAAVLKANAPGEYTLKLTASDEDKVSEKEVTVQMEGNVDGIERASTVITQTGTAPVLPEKMNVIDAGGNRSEKAVVWDEVSSETYQSTGSFVVSGLAGDINTAVQVLVVEGEAKNLAPYAAPTAIINTVSDLGGVASLNDNVDPASSRDTSNGVWHNWHGDQGAPAWVQYDWDYDVTLTGSSAYYFTDGNFAPKTVYLEYKDAQGNWHEVANPNGYGVSLNRYNDTSFEPVTTRSIRMTMTPKTLGIGVIEWKVFGYTEQKLTDKSALLKAINKAKALNMGLFAEGEEAVRDAAVAEAQAAADQADAEQADIDAACEKLSQAILALKTEDGNLAYAANASTSYVSSWESLDAVNDGIVHAGVNPEKPRYGTWGNTSEKETITYEWPSDVKLHGADLYIWTDNGGILKPKACTYEYLDGDGNWTAVPNPVTGDLAFDQFNNTSFDEITTTAIRLNIIKQTADMNGVGVMEWKVYGTVASDEPEPTETPVPTGTPEPTETPVPTETPEPTPTPEPALFDDVQDPEAYYYEPVYWAVDNGITSGIGDNKFGPDNPVTRGQMMQFVWIAAGMPEPDSDTSPFKDVTADQYYYKAVLWASQKKVTSGTGEGRFSPDNTCTRAQIMTFLYAAQGRPDIKTAEQPFKDVPEGIYFHLPVLWAVENQITSGIHPDEFGPDQPCTRGQAVTFLKQAYGR